MTVDTYDRICEKLIIIMLIIAISVIMWKGREQGAEPVRLCHVDDVSLISDWRSNCHASGAYSLAECQRRAESLFCEKVDDIEL